MAGYRAFEAVTRSVVDLLRDSHRPDRFTAPLEFAVFGVEQFRDGLEAGVSVFLHRATINGTVRSPPGRRQADGTTRRPRLPVDLHLLLTAWSREPSMQHAIAGWMMRTLEDHPLLPVGLLNRALGPVFEAGEAVELVSDDLPNEEMLHLWELIGPDSYQLSFPYLARNIHLDSELDDVVAPEVQERQGDFGSLAGAVAR